jgi:hypothetical protein
MDYKKIYDNIIEKRKYETFEGYGETHHIVPKSLGGSDDKANLIRLTAREHFLCHLLLTKIYSSGPNHHKMIRAFVMMLFCHSENQTRYTSSRKYELLRKKFSEFQSKSQSGTKNSQHGTCWIFHDCFGIKKVKKELIDEYIFQGWFLGKSFKFVRVKKNTRGKTLEAKRIKKYPDLEKWYKIYSEKGFTEFVKLTGYKHSQANLVTLFSKYVDSFVPQNGKKRSN